MIKVIKKVKPDAAKLVRLREGLNQTQKGLLNLLEENGYGMSRATYQRIERGEDIQPLYIEKLSKFYSKFFNTKSKLNSKKNFVSKQENYNFESLIVSKNSLKKEDESKKLETNKIDKMLPSFKTEKTYLYSVKNFEEVTKSLGRSNRRKFFYQLTPSTSEGFGYDSSMNEKDSIKDIVNFINDFLKKKINLNQLEITEKFSEDGSEIEQIERISEFGKRINFLNHFGINLYVGVYNSPELSFVPVDNHPSNTTYKYGIQTTPICILCFARETSSDLNFSYDNFFFKEKLQYLLEKNKMTDVTIDDFEGDETKYSTQQGCEAFETQIDYFKGINPSWVQFDKDYDFDDEIPF